MREGFLELVEDEDRPHAAAALVEESCVGAVEPFPQREPLVKDRRFDVRVRCRLLNGGLDLHAQLGRRAGLRRGGESQADVDRQRQGLAQHGEDARTEQRRFAKSRSSVEHDEPVLKHQPAKRIARALAAEKEFRVRLSKRLRSRPWVVGIKRRHRRVARSGGVDRCLSHPDSSCSVP